MCIDIANHILNIVTGTYSENNFVLPSGCIAVILNINPHALILRGLSDITQNKKSTIPLSPSVASCNKPIPKTINFRSQLFIRSRGGCMDGWMDGWMDTNLIQS